MYISEGRFVNKKIKKHCHDFYIKGNLWVNEKREEVH